MESILKTPAIFSLILVILAGIAMGQVPQLINYQGVLIDPSTGQPVPDNSYTITFSIYDVASEGSPVWTETQSVGTKNGAYNVLLGSLTALTPTILNGPEKYLGVKVGNDAEMTPRKRIVSVAYAITSSEVSGTSNVFPSEGAIGIGTVNPFGQLAVYNDSIASYVHIRGVGNEYDYSGLILEAPDRRSWLLNHRTDNSFKIIEYDGGSTWWNRFTIAPGGNVSIGNTNPNFTLDVAGDINFTGSLYQNGNTFSSGSLWAQNGNDIYYTEGKVGIGNASPTHALDIAGKIGINSKQVIYLPDQTDFLGSLYLSDGGASLSHVQTWEGRYNTAIGIGALYANTTGSNNTANGYQALFSNTTGKENTANGIRALYMNTEGFGNTANGDRALYSNTIGNSNTANGSGALGSNTTGYSNTANGMGALSSNTTGVENSATGNSALHDNTTGSENTANGAWALSRNTTGRYNTAVGHNAGYNTCSNGTFLGAKAYPEADGYSNVTGLGYEARSTASNQVRIGNSSVQSIGGPVDWTTFSDGRYKSAITENVKGLDFIMKLRPVTYQLDINKLAVELKEDQRRDEQGNMTTEPSELDIKARNEKSKIVYTGFIGQEVEQAAKEIGYDFSGVDAPKNENDFYGLRYAEFVVPLVKAMQEQQKMIEDLRSEIATLKKKLGE